MCFCSSFYFTFKKKSYSTTWFCYYVEVINEKFFEEVTMVNIMR